MTTASASETSTPGTFQQRIGLFDATMLVAGSMIGSGIFIVSADIARDVGSSGWLLFVWCLTGIITIIGALSYGELAAMMPHAGGQYVYLREAYGPMWGFLYGWTSFLVIQTGTIAAVAVAFAKFLGVLVPKWGTDNILVKVEDLNWKLSVPVPWMEESMTFFERKNFTISAGQLVAVGLIVVLTVLNCRGIREGKWVQNIFTVAKTLALVALIVLGLTVAVSQEAIDVNLNDMWSGITATPRYQEVSRFMPVMPIAVMLVLCGAMVGSLFSADAWHNVTFIAGEVRNPKRNLPWGLFLGTGLVIVLYFLANVAYLAVLPLQGSPRSVKEVEASRELWNQRLRNNPSEEQKKDILEILRRLDRHPNVYYLGIDHAKDDRVGTAVMELVSPHWGAPLMAIAIMISTFGCNNGLILMGPRLYYAMARDRLFFQSAGTLNARGVPALGMTVQGIWTIVLVFSGSYSELLDYVIFAALFFYMFTVSGLFLLRRLKPDAERPYRAFGYPWIPLLYVVLCAVIMLSLLVVKPVYSWPSFIIVLSGIPVYLWWQRKQAVT